MYKLMYDPTSFTPFFRPAPYAIYMDKLYTAPLYIFLENREKDWYALQEALLHSAVV